MPVALVVLLGLLWGFGVLSRPDTGPVAMDAPALTPEAAQVCRAIVADLPETVAGSARRAVTAGPEQNAAYGDPPVTLPCGTVPPAVEDTATVFPLSGVCWFPQPGTDATVWTTVDRAVPVSVTVPGPQEGSAQTVIAFSEAVEGRRPAAPHRHPHRLRLSR